jgi:soluble lytic murein transglycosylase-like protein
MAGRTGLPLPAASQRHEKAALVDPELNLTLAQEYVAMLLKDERIGGNLLLAACAYNAGLGPTLRWEAAEPEFKKDPLLFLESIPSRQARVFTARVLTNYWIYRLRLGQSTRDLDALAAGHWPTYTALDNAPEPGVRHAANR